MCIIYMNTQPGQPYPTPNPPLPVPRLRNILQLYAIELREYAGSIGAVLGLSDAETAEYKMACFEGAYDLERASDCLKKLVHFVEPTIIREAPAVPVIPEEPEQDSCFMSLFYLVLLLGTVATLNVALFFSPALRNLLHI